MTDLGDVNLKFPLILAISVYCRFGNVRKNLLFANIREFRVSQIQSSR